MRLGGWLVYLLRMGPIARAIRLTDPVCRPSAAAISDTTRRRASHASRFRSACVHSFGLDDFISRWSNYRDASDIGKFTGGGERSRYAEALRTKILNSRQSALWRRTRHECRQAGRAPEPASAVDLSQDSAGRAAANLACSRTACRPCCSGYTPALRFCAN